MAEDRVESSQPYRSRTSGRWPSPQLRLEYLAACSEQFSEFRIPNSEFAADAASGRGGGDLLKSSGAPSITRVERRSCKESR